MGLLVDSTTTACKVDACDHARIAYNLRHKIFIRSYYLYCVDLIKNALRETGAQVNVIVGDYAVEFGNCYRVVRVNIQHEHTLVKPGGRDSDDAVRGVIPIALSGESYLVRIQDYEYLIVLDIIVEYSLPNLVNIKESERFDDYLSKTIYLAPLLYEINFHHGRRSREITALFADTRQPRRRLFLDQAKAARLPLKNVKGVYDSEALGRIYRDTKVLVNVHQTEHHHTFEELRVLPALLCGVVIVSEDVPLKEHIPYSRFIVWCAYEDIVATTRSVQKNYEHYHHTIFGNPELVTVLKAMQQSNVRNMRLAFENL